MGASKRTVAVYLFLLQLTASAVGANGASSGVVESGDASGQVGAGREVEALVQGIAAAPVTAANPAAGSAGGAAACLKEGELCNTLNDHCCRGYYCFGGLVPTCFRKP